MAACLCNGVAGAQNTDARHDRDNRKRRCFHIIQRKCLAQRARPARTTMAEAHGITAANEKRPSLPRKRSELIHEKFDTKGRKL